MSEVITQIAAPLVIPMHYFSDTTLERFLARMRESHAIRLGDSRSEEHTSELQSLMRISYAVFCLKKKTPITDSTNQTSTARTKCSRTDSYQRTHYMRTSAKHMSSY